MDRVSVAPRRGARRVAGAALRRPKATRRRSPSRFRSRCRTVEEAKPVPLPPLRLDDGRPYVLARYTLDPLGDPPPKRRFSRRREEELGSRPGAGAAGRAARAARPRHGVMRPNVALRELALAAVALLAVVAALAVTERTRSHTDTTPATGGLVPRPRRIRRAGGVRAAYRLRRRPERRHRRRRSPDPPLRSAHLRDVQRNDGAHPGRRSRPVRARAAVRPDGCACPPARPAWRPDDRVVLRPEQVVAVPFARVLDVVRVLRHHVEPTPCEREPGSGLGRIAPDVLHGTHLACPGSHGAWPIGVVGALGGASAPLTPFDLPVPWPDGRALRRFRARS